jgi:hypothetical protein
MYVKRNKEARSCNHCCSAKATRISYPECVFVALGIQHTKCMPPFISSSVACPVLKYISTLSHKRHKFKKKKILNMKCEFRFSLQLLSETFLILRNTERHMLKNVY